MTLRKSLIVLDVVIIALAIVVVFSLMAGRNSKKHYYQNAHEAYLKAEQAAASWDTGSEPGKLYEVSSLYRIVFDDYPDSRWADDAIYRLASNIDPSEEEAIILYRKQGNFPSRQTILSNELVFNAGFFLFLLIRIYLPQIYRHEKFMDFAFLNTVMRTASFPRDGSGVNQVGPQFEYQP